MMTYTRFAIAAIGALTVGCSASGPTEDAPVPDPSLLTAPALQSALDGPWTRLGQVPGSSERWNLAVTDTVVTGTGQWSGEACCSGTLSIAGFASNGTVRLTIKFFNQDASSTSAPRFVETVDAVVQSATDIVGTVAIDAQPAVKAHWRKGTSPF